MGQFPPPPFFKQGTEVWGKDPGKEEKLEISRECFSNLCGPGQWEVVMYLWWDFQGSSRT